MRFVPVAPLLALALTLSSACTDDPVRDVARAATARTAAARLTIPVRAAACVAAPRDTTPCVADPARLTSHELRAARRAEQRLRAAPDARAWHAAGLADLLWGDTAGNALDRSISRLQTAARLGERSAPALADLSAAYLARAVRSRDPRDLLEAMEAASRALEQSPGDPVAATDLAIALERIGAYGRAARAWAEVADAERDPRWRDAASARRDSLARRLARGALVLRALPVADAALVALADTLPQEARTTGWTGLLRTWGDAAIAGDTAVAARALARAERLGAALDAHRRDCTLLDAVRVIRAHEGDHAVTLRLARAHAAFARGQLRLDSLDHRGAIPELRAALAEDAPSPVLNAWATLLAGIADVYAGELERAVGPLRDVATAVDTMSQVALAARAHWAYGVTLLRIGRRADEGIAALRASERLYARSGEREYLGVVRGHLAEALLAYGHTAEGWSMLNRALLTLGDYPWTRARHGALYNVVHFATRDGYLRAARLLQEEAIAVARRTRTPAQVAEAMLAGARLEAIRGDHPAAARQLDAARVLVGQLPDGDVRGWFEADLALSRAVATIERQPAAAVEALDFAERFHRARMTHLPRRLTALLGRAQAALRLRDEATAARSLAGALDLLDAQRDSIGDPTVRAGLLESARAAIDAMVVHEAPTRPVRALEWLERGRTSLVARGGRRRASSPGALRAPSGTVVVDYALLGDTLYTWTVADSVRLTTAAAPVRLTRTVERVRSAMEMGFAGAELQADLAALYDLLVRPIADRLGPDGTPVVIVADGAIGNVPFAVLRDATRDRYLVERHPLRFAASLADATLPPAPARDAAPLVLVGEPALAPGTREAGVELPPLRGAADEVRAIAAASQDLSQVAVLSGADATPEALRDAFARAGILHYAGHAVLDDARAEQSWLALARDASGRSRLTAEELGRLDLSRLRLVVLSACQTLRARDGRAGGFAGFAEALLSAGAGGVVGSLWRVDDATTRELMVDFHHARVAHGDVARALQAVQVQWIRSPDARRRSPAAWGAFRYAGR